MELSDVHFRSFVDGLEDGVYFVDTSRVIHFWNKGAERISGYDRSDVMGRSCAENILVHVNDAGECLCGKKCPLAATIHDGQERRCRVHMKHREGHRIPVRLFASPIRDKTGAIIGAVETFRDDTVTPFSMEEVETLKRELYQCPLTAVPNRRFADERLSQRYREASQTVGVGVLFIDVDHFKSINDTHGHHVGDMILKMVAQTLAHGFRREDALARWGGEEFIALVPAQSEAELFAIGERLRLLIQRSILTTSDGRLSVTASLGGLFVTQPVQWQKAVQEADRLMYASKANGRNRTTTGTI